MNSRERVLMAINHEEPDKVPIDSWLAPEISEVLVDSLNIDISKDPFSLSKALKHDLLYGFLGFCNNFDTIYHEELKIDDNLYQDNWGIKWRKVSHQYGSYSEFAGHPFEDIKNYDKFKWPDPLEIEKDGICMYKNLIKNEGKEYAILGGVACTMLEASWYLRGLERFLMDFYLNRDFAIELLDKTMLYSLEISKVLVELGVDIIWWGDDISVERGPLVDPKIYRELIKPRHAHMVEEVKKINKDVKVAFHSDGNIEWALDDLIEIGIDIINPLQPDANDIAEIKRKYGKKLTVWGNVDTRKVMSQGSAADVINEVRDVISTLSPGGGHILCTNHTVQATDRAVDNTLAYYWAAEQFRTYPINLESKKHEKTRGDRWII